MFNHLSTERLCTEDGFAFAPIVVEACGGSWGPSATKIFLELAKTKSILSGESQDVVRTQLFQSLGVILHRENARAVARRMFPSFPLRHHFAGPAQCSFHAAGPGGRGGRRVSCFGRSLCPSPCSCLVSLPLWPCVARWWGPHRWRSLRVPPRPRLLLFFLSIYILIRFWGVMASCGFVRSKRFCIRSGTPIFRPGSWLGPVTC